MQIEHIRGGIVDLRRAQLCSPPVRALLLLGDVNAEQVLQQVPKTMPVSIGAHQLASDLGAIDRRGDRPKGVHHRGNVETSEMKQLEHIRVFQKADKVRRLALALGDLHQMRMAIAPRKLHDAQPVPVRMKPHGLAIYRHDRSKIQIIGQIALVNRVRHIKPSSRGCAGNI